MKKLLILLFFPMIVLSQTAPTSIDTIAIVNGKPKFLAFWNLTVSTTPDTLIMPYPASKIEVVHRGATSGDTLDISYSQSGGANYGSMLIANGESLFRNFNIVISGSDAQGVIKKIYIKGRQTFSVWVFSYN